MLQYTQEAQLSFSMFIPSRSDAHDYVVVQVVVKRNPSHIKSEVIVERVTGIEPALSAWKAEALPLSYTRVPQLVMHNVFYFSKLGAGLKSQQGDLKLTGGNLIRKK